MGAVIKILLLCLLGQEKKSSVMHQGLGPAHATGVHG